MHKEVFETTANKEKEMSSRLDQDREKELAEIRRQMKMSKPLIGYLGNQYFYWKEQYDKLKNR